MRSAPGRRCCWLLAPAASQGVSRTEPDGGGRRLLAETVPRPMSSSADFGFCTAKGPKVSFLASLCTHAPGHLQPLRSVSFRALQSAVARTELRTWSSLRFFDVRRTCGHRRILWATGFSAPLEWHTQAQRRVAGQANCGLDLEAQCAAGQHWPGFHHREVVVTQRQPDHKVAVHQAAVVAHLLRQARRAEALARRVACCVALFRVVRRHLQRVLDEALTWAQASSAAARRCRGSRSSSWWADPPRCRVLG